MTKFLDPPLVPRNGHKSEILSVCRVSDPGPGKQDIRSNDDQNAKLQQWLGDYVVTPLNTTLISGSGSGESLERLEYLRILDEIASEKYDLLLTEDLGRIARRIQAHLVCEYCVQHGTRLIAINDNIDTARHGWQDASIFSAWHHERSNRDTSDRIKRTHRNRFDSGGCAAFQIYGIIKPSGSKNDTAWLKDPAAEPIYKHWFKMLEEGALYAEVADWLNAQNVPTGPFCRNETWDGPMVGRVTHNPLLKGYRRRNVRKSKRNSNGKYVSVKADPNELRLRHVPHLAFFEEPYYDYVVAKADERNRKYRRKGKDGHDTRSKVPKKRTRFPGQMVVCGICGRDYVFGGHGQTDHLMCNGARSHNCWNGITFDGQLAAEVISASVLNAIEQLPNFDEHFLQTIHKEANRLDHDRDEALREYDRRQATCERQINNLMKFIIDGDVSSRVRMELYDRERELQTIMFERNALFTKPTGGIIVPPIDAVKAWAMTAMKDLALDSWEFCKQMRVIIPKIVVFPHRLCDGGAPVLRGRFRLFLSHLLESQRLQNVLEQPLEQLLTVDLFPLPQREAYRTRVVEKRKEHRERIVAAELGITITAAQRAAALQRMMDKMGITDPYLPLTEPPDDFAKLRRHKHPRYRFEPLPGAGEV